MATDVLRSTVHDYIGAVDERVLQWWWRERGVNEEVSPCFVGFSGVVGYIECEASRVNRGLEDDEVTFLESGVIAVQWEDFRARETGM